MNSKTTQTRFIALLGVLFTLSIVQGDENRLSPSERADKYIVEAASHLENERWGEASDALEKITKLGVNIPTQFWLSYGDTLLKAGRHAKALSAIDRYLDHPGPSVQSRKKAIQLRLQALHPYDGRRVLLSCKLSMIPREVNGIKLTLSERLRFATKAGFGGVDMDQAGEYTPEQVRMAAREAGVLIHNAVNHTHWLQRLTSASEAERSLGRANLEHCIRVSHAAGGSGVLIVLGKGDDGPADVVLARCRTEIEKVLPLAASLKQMILIENVWNRMMYDHDAPPEQTPEAFIRFIDSFESPWIGMYYDIGNHWKYGQPGEWIRAFGDRCIKLDVKGFSRRKNKFVDITSPDDDLPWDEVRVALKEIGFTGWATAEVGGGDLHRLVEVRKQMERAFGELARKSPQ